MSNRFVVFNSELERFGNRHILKRWKIPTDDQDPVVSAKHTLATFFEQLMLFDKVAIKVDRDNMPLYFLIRQLGINNVERLIDEEALNLVLWTPNIFTSAGKQLPNGSIDEKAVLGTPPLHEGFYTQEDSDPEHNIMKVLSNFQLPEERKRIFMRRARKQFVLPNNEFAGKSKEIVLDAYNQNRLAHFGLPMEKDANWLTVEERLILMELSNQVMETALLAENRYKSYNIYSYHALTSDAIKNIESALDVSENTSEMLNIEGIADLRNLVFDRVLKFEDVYKLRYRPVARHYRKWINTVSADPDAKKFSIEYADAITGKNNFMQGTGGKFLRTTGMFMIGSGIAMACGSLGIGGVAAKAVDYGLGLFDTYVLDGVLSGWNPRMFVEEVKGNIKEKTIDA